MFNEGVVGNTEVASFTLPQFSKDVPVGYKFLRILQQCPIHLDKNTPSHRRFQISEGEIQRDGAEEEIFTYMRIAERALDVSDEVKYVSADRVVFSEDFRRSKDECYEMLEEGGDIYKFFLEAKMNEHSSDHDVDPEFYLSMDGKYIVARNIGISSDQKERPLYKIFELKKSGEEGRFDIGAVISFPPLV